MFRRKTRCSRRGSIYVAVLGASMIVVVIGVGALLAVRARARTVEVANEAEEARLCARSGIELARLWISQDPNWRSALSGSPWTIEQQIGNGTVVLEVIDQVDGDPTNRPYDDIVLKATGTKGKARQILQVTLRAEPTPMDALKYAIHTGGQLHVGGGKSLTVGTATVSTNGSLRNDGTITGNVEAWEASKVGDVTGTVVLGVPPKAFPASTVPEMYAALGTEINPGGTIDKRVLSPGLNPWGDADPDGVYVIRTAGDTLIRNTLIHGTLVVICPGRKVTIDSQVLFHPARADYPVLIVVGDVEFACNGSGTPLSEAAAGKNFNPPGAPYEGISDSDLLDEYASEIRGLVHVTGKVELKQTTVIRGALISESTAVADAVNCTGSPEIVYDPNLYANPPQGYTGSVEMPLQPGTWRRVTTP